jgi:hypothetical protein
MFCNKLLQGFLTVCLVNLSMAQIPAISFPIKSSHPQTIAQATNKLTEPAIRQILEEMKMAQEKEDIATMLKYIAPFTYTEVTVETANGRLTVNVLGTAEHSELLERAAQIRSTSRILAETVEVNLAENGEFAVAEVYTLREITTDQGATIMSASNDTLRFGIVNNQPMVVSANLSGWLSVLSTPGAK